MNAPAKIVTHCEFPPIPVRDHDWCAWYEGLGPECACGWGETEAAAIADLRDNYDAPVNLLSATEATKRIRAIADKLDARDDDAMSYAVANLATGRPAFWSTAKYHDAPGSIFRSYVNSDGGNILLAVGAIEHDFRGTGNRYGSIAMLDALLPLNEAAVEELAFAYRRAGTWREPNELLARTAKVEGSRLPTINAIHEAA